ncbi:MAG: 50S ribosomal protein L28 [Chloroflexi bacterium]|nr:50S ribosomal protein L28 [Chloroflexota bacterium]
MPGKCQICGKVPASGNNVSHSKRHTRRVWGVNVQQATIMVDGIARRVRACTRCLRTLQKTPA